MLKDIIKKALKGLPKEAQMGDLMYRLYVLDRIEKAEAEADKGETLNLDQLRQEVAKW